MKGKNKMSSDYSDFLPILNYTTFLIFDHDQYALYDVLIAMVAYLYRHGCQLSFDSRSFRWNFV